MKKKQWICLGTIILAIVLITGGYCGYRLIRHEKAQNQQIQSMQASISKLSAELDAMSEPEIEWLDDGTNYFAIGNSITLHGTCDYWWNEVGMAASDANHDYYHLVLNQLESTNGKAMGQAFNFYVWETQSHDRDEVLDLLDPYLSTKLDIITIQLGENVSDTTTYEEDFVSLINYIKAKAPNARILVVDDFWNNGDRNQLKLNAVETAKVEHVSLEGITDNSEYYCGIGTTVYDADGNAHIVEHDGVANHPGDSGMEAIASRIIEVIQK